MGGVFVSAYDPANGPGVIIIACTLSIRASQVAINNVSPGTLTVSSMPQTLVFSGSGFQSGLTAVLTPPGGTTSGSAVPVSNVGTSSFQITAALSSSGTYQIVATNPDGSVSNAFQFQVAASLVRTISHVADGGGWSTTIILVNLDSTPASFSLQFTGDNGSPFAPSLTGLGKHSTVTGTIQVGGSTTISTDGSAAQLSEGWARVTTSQAIDGTAIFRLAQPKGSAVPYQEAAVPLLSSGNGNLMFPFDNNTGLATGVALAAPDNSISTMVAWRERNQAGQNLTASPEQPQVLPAYGHDAFVLPVDSTDAANLRGVAEFDSQSGAIFGLGIRSHGSAFTSVEAVTPQPAATKIISHVGDGGTWKTTIILVNTDTVPASFQVNLWQDNGSVFSVQLVGSPAQSTISGTIPVGGSYTIETADLSPQTTTGWAEVLSSQSIGGTAIFRLEMSGQEAAVPLLTSGGKKLMLPFDSGSGFALGVALANTSLSQDATITYQLRDENGNAIPNNPPGIIVLPRHQHYSVVLPVNLNGASELRGVVEFDSPSVPIFALGIRSNSGAFTSVRALGQ